jgi:hypothetical protein
MFLSNYPVSYMHDRQNQFLLKLYLSNNQFLYDSTISNEGT